MEMYRIDVRHCGELKIYVIQKRQFLFFWKDVSRTLNAERAWIAVNRLNKDDKVKLCDIISIL